MTADNMTMRPTSAPSPLALSLRTDTIGSAGAWATHYALALIFLWFGALKFTDFEASGIAPLVINSPLVMWLNGLLGVGGTAHAIGVYELLTGILLALRSFKPKLSAIGGGMAVLCFLITLSFLFTTPGVVQAGFDSPLALSVMPGQFLLKDLVLLCVSVWALGASRMEARAMR